MLRRASTGGMLLLSLAAACSSSDDTNSGTTPTPVAKPRHPPTAIPSVTDAPTTLDKTLVPKMAVQVSTAGKNPALPDALADYLSRGFGDFTVGPGEPYTTRVIDGSTPPAAGANAKRILRFVHMADTQIPDDESPTRLGQFDAEKVTSSALRPQDAYLCHMANATVRTINALHKKDPVAFTLLGGDNGDSAQTNEENWILDILSGSNDVECDSGADDEIEEGPDNDGKDPFKAEGLAMPWKWVTGNHDVLVQGNLVGDASQQEKVLGTDATGGTRFYSEGKKGAVERGEGVVVADAKRKLLARTDLMALIASNKDGHGIGDAEKSSGMATYTFDADGTPFRFLVIDTAHTNGGSEGVITQGEVDRVIKPLLDKAKGDGKWVIMASHHAVTSLGDGTGLGGKLDPTALTPDAWSTFVGGYPNVVFSMVGHSHRHRVRPIQPAGGHAWWEVMTSAIADYPHQFRVIEIFDQDNGWIMMRATCVDFSHEGDPVAVEGKKRGIVDFTSGWLPTDADIAGGDKNVEIWIPKPQ